MRISDWSSDVCSSDLPRTCCLPKPMRWSPKPCGSIDRACGHARRGVGGGMVPFSFAGEDLLIMGQGALFWTARKALLIADMHQEKASFFERFGQKLPPYDSNATLAAIEALVDETGAREIRSLGESFQDGEGPFRLDEQEIGRAHV